VLFRSGW